MSYAQIIAVQFRSFLGAEGDFSVEWDNEVRYYNDDRGKHDFPEGVNHAVKALLIANCGTADGVAPYFHLSVKGGQVDGFGMGLCR